MDHHKIVSCGECGKQAPGFQMHLAKMDNGLAYYLCDEHAPNTSVQQTVESCPPNRHVYYTAFLSYVFCPYCGERLHSG